MACAGLGWLRRRDPDLIAIRRAGRVTIVASLIFYVSYYLVDDRDAATYGLFAAVAMGFLSQVPGPPRRRATTLLRSLPVAVLLVTAGTLLAGNLWIASLGVLAFGFVVAYASAGGPSLSGVAAGLQLFFILACFPPYAPQTLTSRLAGVVLGMGLLAVAERTLWPEPVAVTYLQRLAGASAQLADDLRARAAGSRRGSIDWPDDAVWPPGLPPAARPTSAGRRDRALKDAGRALSFALARLREVPDDAPPPVVVEPLRRAAVVAAASAEALRGGPPPATDDLWRATSTARSRRPAPATTPAEASAVQRCLDAAEGVWSMATAVRLAVGAPVGSRGSRRFPYASQATVNLWWQRFAVHLNPRSVYFQSAVRIAAALAAARLVAGTLELSHGFWVLLAALTLLRGRAAATGMTLGPAAAGTVIGAAAAGVLLVSVGPRTEVYAALTPPVMALAFAAGALLGLAWGQALFTLLVTLVFTQLAPAGLQIAEVRVLDVLLGAAIGVIAGVLAWPRGAAGELRRSAARLLAAAGALARNTGHALTSPAPTQAPTWASHQQATARVRDRMDLVEAAYTAYQAEQRADASGPRWPAVMTVADHLMRGSDILLDARGLLDTRGLFDTRGLDARGQGSLVSQRSTVTGWASGVGDACDAVSAALRTGRAASLSTVVGPLTDAALADVHVWLCAAGQDLMRTSAPEPTGSRQVGRHLLSGESFPNGRDPRPRRLTVGVGHRREETRMAVKTEPSTRIRPFMVDVPQAELEVLRERISSTRWPEKETVADQSQGVPFATMQALARYWASEYEWRRFEAKLNSFPQFMTEIDGLDIHFIHVRSKHDDALPLILTHGWPGSIVEMLNVIGPLTDPTAHGGSADDAFHVVIPSLPGFGFSGKPTAPGWNPEHIAQAWVELMKRLGYQQFVAQGGDWGAIIVDVMGAQAPQGLLGIHSNMPGILPPDVAKALATNVLGPGDPRPSGLSPEENRAFEQLSYFYTKGIGYGVEMALRPQTLYGLSDSPIALAAWMLDHDARSLEDISRAFVETQPVGSLTRDEILDNITLTWLTNTGVSSARIYWENKLGFFDVKGVSVPAAVSVFPRELYQAPRSWTEQAYQNLIYFNEVDKGNHFAAWQEPDLFATEVRAGFRSLR